MKRDFKNSSSKKVKRRVSPKKQARRPQKKPTPGWVWLLGGLGIGLVVAVGTYLLGKSEGVDASIPVSAPASVAVVKAPPIKLSKPAPEPSPEIREVDNRFDFYHLLSELEVIIPVSEIKALQADIAPKKNVTYFLQAGAFRKFEDADRRKAELALLAIEAELKNSVHKDKTWFRIMVGPFKNMRQLNQTRNRLESNNIETLTLKKDKN